MGQITISIAGSFGRKNGTKSFSAMRHGHADAVAEAITYLSKEVLPFATALDHELHDNGDRPNQGFSREGPEGGEKPEIILGSDICWQFYPSKQYDGLHECVAVDPSGETYSPVTTPCGRILLRKVKL